MRKLLVTSFFLALTSFSSSAFSSECGRVSIADMNWDSATLIASLDRFILEHGFGCDVQVIAGDTMPTGASMIAAGQPDIVPEFWNNSFKQALDLGVQQGVIRYAGSPLSDGGEEGFWVPDYMVEKDPALATIAGIKANAALFRDPQNPGKSVFMGCPVGWNCRISAGHLFRALQLDKFGFDLVDPGSGIALAASIAEAYERKQAWFGYYWAPTSVLGKYKMVKVDFGSGTDEQYFKECIIQHDCAAPKVTMYPLSVVDTVVTERFAKNAPEALAYISARSFTNVQMNQLLAWMEKQQADGEETVEYFLAHYPGIWTEWLDTATVGKIKKALSEIQ
ncbi:ABC transporter substrate-binding protein [Psychromonas ossibalaenae]|uniref:ABC transporter substrate-binding protein n=1 Tax=Psychromonas ossibalaenae TaxID=444922 RepID=UPI000380E76C|nr:ABC transporter substrate-binding protein [Psychromonas ossibalaenae]